MHVLLSLLAREVFLLALLVAVGVAPAALLSRRIDAPTRIALAPALGLAVALCAMTTAVWRVPTNQCFWLLPLLAIVSVGVGVWLSRRRRPDPPQASAPRWRPDARSLVQILLVIVIVGGAFNLPLVQSRSVGPAGYDVSDAADYVSYQDGLRTQSVHAAAVAAKVPINRRADLIQSNWTEHAAGFQEVGFDAVASSADVILDLGGSQTYSAFMIVILEITALGLFAAVRVIVGGRPWAAVLAGVLVAGPFWIQLFMVGSEAGQVGLALLAPLLITVYLALRGPQPAAWVLLALLAAGLQTAYPLFVPPLAVAAAAALAVLAVVGWSRGELTRHRLWQAGLVIFGVLILSVVFTPYAFVRNLRYWTGVLDGSLGAVYGGLPQYVLPPALIPSWLLQMRWLYFLPQSYSASTLPGSILGPLAMLATIAFAVRRRLVLLGALAIIAAGALLGLSTWQNYHCSYCVDRNLLVASPLGTVLFAIGVAMLLATTRTHMRLLGCAVVVIALLGIGAQVRVGQLYLRQAAYTFDPQTRAVISRLPPHPPPLSVAMEGFGQTVRAPLEDSVVYAAVRHATGVPPSLPTETNDYSGLAYLGGPSPAGAAFDPAYQYVMTRLAGIDTGRPVIFRDGAVALERRAGPLDVIVTGGVEAALAPDDPQGRAWIQPQAPLTMWISGTHTGEPVSLELGLRATVPVRIVPTPGMVLRRQGADLRLCADLSGAGAFRRFGIKFQFTPVPQPVPKGQEYGVPPPPQGLQLVSMRASSMACSAGPGIRPARG